MSYELLSKNKVSLKVNSIRDYKQSVVFNIVIFEPGEGGRTYESFYAATGESINESLDKAKLQAISEFFGTAPKPKKKKKQTDEIKEESKLIGPAEEFADAVKVMIGDTPKEEVKEEAKPKKKVKAEASPRPVKKKTRASRKAKPAAPKEPAEEFEQDGILEIIKPMVCYDPSNDNHKANLGRYLDEHFKDWRNNQALKQMILDCVRTLKQSKCMHEATGEVSEDMDNYFANVLKSWGKK